MTRNSDSVDVSAQDHQPEPITLPQEIEISLASKIRHSVVEYINFIAISKSEFCKITGLSDSYIDKLFEKPDWELTEAVRLAGFLKMKIDTIIHWPKPRRH